MAAAVAGVRIAGQRRPPHSPGKCYALGNHVRVVIARTFLAKNFSVNALSIPPETIPLIISNVDLLFSRAHAGFCAVASYQHTTTHNGPTMIHNEPTFIAGFQ